MKNKAKYLTKGPVVFALALVCCLLWGSAFPTVKIGYRMFGIAGDDSWTQILFAGMRFTGAGVMVIAILSAGRRRLVLPKRTALPLIAKLGFVQTVAQYILFYIGLANTAGVKASIIDASSVFTALLISCLIFRYEKLTWLKVLCCIIGLGGVVVINLSGSGFDMDMSFRGEGLLFLSSLAYALSSNLIKSYSQHEDPVVLSGYQFIFGGTVMIAAGLLGGGRIHGIMAGSAMLLLYLCLISAVAYSLWGLLLEYNPVSRVAVYGFLNPVFGVLLSALLLGEGSRAFGVQGLSALVLVSLGIFLGNADTGRKQIEETDSFFGKMLKM